VSDEVTGTETLERPARGAPKRGGRGDGSPPPDADLLARLREGEEAAFEQLVRENTGRMLAVARRFLPSDDDAQDAVQEAFASAFRALPRFEGGSRLSTWLHRITVNACLMKLRTRRRKPEESIDNLLPGFLEDGHAEKTTPAWRQSADELIERAENRALVREAIEKLPDSYRTVLLLRDIEEFDTETTAKELDITVAAVKTRLHRARMALKTLLDESFSRDAQA
jgi:RNA polymerase sigma-70 factor (ECF subfamily)